MDPKPLPALPGHRFTTHDYGWAFLQLDPELIDHALHLALHSIRVSFSGNDGTLPAGVSAAVAADYEAIHHDLMAAAELAKALAVADHPVICATLGRGRRELLSRIMDKRCEADRAAEAVAAAKQPGKKARRPAKKGAPTP